MHRSLSSSFPPLVALGLITGACAHTPALPSPAPSSGQEYRVVVSAVPREQLPEEQIHQVLNRLAFGPRPGNVEQVRSMGVDQWIARQLAPERIPDPRVDELMPHYEVLNTPTPELVGLYRQVQQARRRELQQMRADGDTVSKAAARREAMRDDPELRDLARKAQKIVGDVQSAKLARAVVSDRQLQEVMVDFWENHFSVYAGKGQTRLFLASYDRDVIRPHALGKFRDLLEAVAKSPAMLFFLDNWESAADSAHPTLAAAARASRVTPARGGRRVFLPGRGARRQPASTARPASAAAARRPKGLNENYARELMELHTLGVDGGYTQHDVIEVARALTGWSIDLRSGSFVFRPQMHDAGEKVVLGHTLPAGRGIEDGEQVLDILARQPATARFITTKLVRRFVSDSAPPTLVDRCATTFAQTDGDIRETVRCIVTSQEFFSRSAYRAKVKTPFEVVASGLRAMGAGADTTARSAQIVARMGQPIFGRQTPDGWPDRGDAWMNTGAILNRINFGLALAAGRVPAASMTTWPYAAELRSADRTTQADDVIRTILGGSASPETRSILLSGENPMLGRFAASDSGVSSLTRDSSEMTMSAPPPSRRAGGALAVNRKGLPRANGMRALDQPVALHGLAQVVGLALGSPEFQRR
ncbi:MAG TPA: DUF1800 domain-containing protein [Gemmatimonadaceae bacterium]|nr:DUF1800 domain-containing protein [Gemmatimonadaceae bacterium]